jgi:predicted nucleic-acid-binding protein
MLAADTNVLLRYFLKDDPEQFALASKAFDQAKARDESIWISTIVLAEFIWTLSVRKKPGRLALADLVADLLEIRELEFESEDAVLEALRTYRASSIGFVDALLSVLARAQGCRALLSFDKKMIGSGLGIQPG